MMRLFQLIFYFTSFCVLVLLYINYKRLALGDDKETKTYNKDLKLSSDVRTGYRQEPSQKTTTKTEEPKAELKPIKVKGADAFIYSVVLLDSSVETKTGNFRVHGIERKSTNPALTCCFHGNDGLLLAAQNSRLVDIFSLGAYHSSVYGCETDLPTDNISFLTIRQECGSVQGQSRDGIQFTRSERPSGEIAVCVHAVYGYLDTEQIVEWMEMVWLQGVRRVFVYPLVDVDKVDPRTLRVFQFYQARGLVQIIPYILAISPRGQGLNLNRFRANARTHQMFSDEFVPIFDCFSRAHNYKYTAIMDFDEIIVNPTQPLNLIPTLNALLHKNPTAAYFRFSVENFVKNWTTTIDRSKPMVMQYVNRTAAMNDRVKNVYVHRRVNSINMHRAVPSRGYRQVHVPKEVAAIHHYTNCRYLWSQEYCFHELKRYKDESLLIVEKLLNQRLQNVPMSVRNGTAN